MAPSYNVDTWTGQLPNLRQAPAMWSFRLNGSYVSYLQCHPVGRIPAFSGSGSARNDFKSTNKEGVGPLPLGIYYIVDRQSGGKLGWLKDTTYPAYSGVDRTKWFALWNSVSGDSVTIKGVKRQNFRLHPAGFWGISEGCITITNGYDFEQIERYLRSRSPDLPVPGQVMLAHGFIEVTL